VIVVTDTYVKHAFFSKNRNFYRRLFTILLTVSLQNVIAYSVNMADNLMLGSYSQVTLSGAATVNQIFFMVQQLSVGICDSLVIIGSQYWGRKNVSALRKVGGCGLKLAFGGGALIFALCAVFPSQLMAIFTTDADIAAEGMAYMAIIKYTFILFLVTQALLATLRCADVVRIAFIVSCVSLVVNVGINYCLIFGKLGMPEMGIRGAAVGTLIARCVELAIVVVYILKKDRMVQLFSENPLKKDPGISHDFSVLATQILVQELFWAVSIPLQSAILGHLSSDAIAANSIATTFYQYLKVVVRAMASASAVMIGSAIGRGNIDEVKAEGRTLSVIDLMIGAILGMVLFLLHRPLLSMYALSDSAYVMADQLLVLMAFLMVTMGYMMPVMNGILRGGGDAKFTLYVNMIGTWAVVVPLSFMSAFWWKLPVVWVVFFSQSDQVFKAPIAFFRFCTYKWIRKLTRDS